MKKSSSESAVKLLLVEDDPDDQLIMDDILSEQRRLAVDWVGVYELGTGVHYVGESLVDVVLLDLTLPDSSGLETLTNMLKSSPATPVIVVTGTDDEELASSAVRHGAKDYLVKGKFDTDRLLHSIVTAMNWTVSANPKQRRDASAIRIVEAHRDADETFANHAALLNVTRDAMLVQDMHDHIVYWNRAAERIYGWTADQAAGMTYGDLVSVGYHADLAIAADVVRNAGVWDGILHQISRTGDTVVVLSRWTLMRDDNKRPVGILIVDTDITKRRSARVR